MGWRTESFVPLARMKSNGNEEPGIVVAEGARREHVRPQDAPPLRRRFREGGELRPVASRRAADEVGVVCGRDSAAPVVGRNDRRAHRTHRSEDGNRDVAASRHVAARRPSAPLELGDPPPRRSPARRNLVGDERRAARQEIKRRHRRWAFGACSARSGLWACW
jgi:hypothetical protein